MESGVYISQNCTRVLKSMREVLPQHQVSSKPVYRSWATGHAHHGTKLRNSTSPLDAVISTVVGAAVEEPGWIVI